MQSRNAEYVPTQRKWAINRPATAHARNYTIHSLHQIEHQTPHTGNSRVQRIHYRAVHFRSSLLPLYAHTSLSFSPTAYSGLFANAMLPRESSSTDDRTAVYTGSQQDISQRHCTVSQIISLNKCRVK